MKMVLAVAVAISGLLVAAPTHADDQRPCVSKVEYRSAPALHLSMRGGQSALNRRALERLWDVRGLGVIDPVLSDDRSSLWMYPACGYSFKEAQIWVVTTGRNGAGDVMLRWLAPDATLHGHP